MMIMLSKQLLAQRKAMMDAETQPSYDDLQHENVALKQEVARLKLELEATKRAYKTASTGALKQTVASLQEANESLEVEIFHLRDSGGLAEEVEDLEAQMLVMHKKVADANKLARDYKALNDDTGASLDSAWSTILDLQDEVASLEKELMDTRHKNQVLSHNLDVYANKVKILGGEKIALQLALENAP